MRVKRELVLLLAGDAVFLRDVLAGDAHVVVVVNIPQAIVHHGVDDLRIAQTISFARLRQKIRGVGHRFHTAGDDDGTVFRLDRLCRECDCFESGATNLVDGHGTHFRRQSAENCGLTRGILSQPGRDHVAHDAFVHLLGIEFGALHCLAHHDGTQLGGAQIGQASLKFSHRRATA